MIEHDENSASGGENDGASGFWSAMSRREALAKLGMVIIVPAQLPSYIAPSLTLLRQTAADGGRKTGGRHVRPSFCPPPRRSRNGNKPSFDCK